MSAKKSKKRITIQFVRDVDADSTNGESLRFDKGEEFSVLAVEKQKAPFGDMSFLVLLNGDRVPLMNEDFEVIGKNPPAQKGALADAKRALKFIGDRDVPGEDPDNQPNRIDLRDIGITDDPDPFICTNTSVIMARLLKKHGAEVFGFAAEDNPTASIADDYDGHDFAVLPDGTIIDWWRTIHTMRESDPAIITPGSPEYKEYGDRSKWKLFDAWGHDDWKWTKKIPAIDEIKKK